MCRVMRLSKAPLQPTSHTLVDLGTDFLPDDEAAAALQQRRDSSAQATTSDRTQLHSPLDICNIDGMLELPTSFGSMFLGEAFQSYVSIINASKITVTAVHCKAELESSRGRVSLYEGPAQELSLQPGARHDFLIRHDVKDTGSHTLTCSAAYTMPEGERQTLPQTFKFTSSNPLSVRTKSRRVQDLILLEACIENISRLPLVLDYLRFDPQPHMSVEQISQATPPPTQASIQQQLQHYAQTLQVITPGGGALNLLFKLRSKSSEGSKKSPEGIDNGVMGKLDIKWRTTMGGVGRLQTQPIAATSAITKDISLKAIQLPSEVFLEKPFAVTARIESNIDRRCHGLTLECSKETLVEGVSTLGPTSISLPDLAPYGSSEVEIVFVSLKSGMTQLPHIMLSEGSQKLLLDTLTVNVKVV